MTNTVAQGVLGCNLGGSGDHIRKDLGVVGKV